MVQFDGTNDRYELSKQPDGSEALLSDAYKVRHIGDTEDAIRVQAKDGTTEFVFAGNRCTIAHKGPTGAAETIESLDGGQSWSKTDDHGVRSVVRAVTWEANGAYYAYEQDGTKILQFTERADPRFQNFDRIVIRDDRIMHYGFDPQGKLLATQTIVAGKLTENLIFDGNAFVSTTPDGDNFKVDSVGLNSDGGYTRRLGDTSITQHPDGRQEEKKAITAAAQTNETYAEQLGGRQFTVEADGGLEYEVAAGDSLWSIASSVLAGRSGQNPPARQIVMLVAQIAEANSNLILNPDLIYEHQRIVVPPSALQLV